MNRLRCSLVSGARLFHVSHVPCAGDGRSHRAKSALDLRHNFEHGTQRPRNGGEPTTRVGKENEMLPSNVTSESASFARTPLAVKLPMDDERLRKRNDHRFQPPKSTSYQNRRRIEKPDQTSLILKQHNNLNKNILFGIHPVLLALKVKRRRLKKLFVKNVESDRIQEIVAVACESDIPIQTLMVEELDRLTGGRVHQGVCLMVTDLPIPTMHDTINTGESGRLPLWLLLHQIFDPMNMGAILRTAYFMGVDGILGSKEGNCPLSPVVSKASSGAMELAAYYHLDDVEQFLMKQKERNWEIVGTISESDNSSCSAVVDIHDLNVTKPTIIVFGNEGTGISEGLQQLCTANITIAPGPQVAEKVSSLNVSVAAGIVLHSIRHKLKLNTA